ncbi:MAG: carbohydrate-binding family 9-like protein [Desulfobulbaceae bacterium]|nr:carbohydrate-binding family 9-like protein [Desulfobulbaceae bacterium]
MEKRRLINRDSIHLRNVPGAEVEKIPLRHRAFNSNKRKKNALQGGKTSSTQVIHADWDKSPWQDIPSVMLRYFMGRKPDHFPRTEVKLAWDDTAVYVIFRVAARYVRAVARDHQGNVWEDSCVEFFFTPDSDVSRGYFNLEMNCGGTMLLHFQRSRGKGRIIIPKEECNRITAAHSLPRIDPEIEDPVRLDCCVFLPIILLKKYCHVTTPSPGAAWRANFYKCGDRTSHPHWLTWAPVHSSKPDFHQPASFGILQFE